jgi:hypothetical protein
MQDIFNSKVQKNENYFIALVPQLGLFSFNIYI